MFAPVSVVSENPVLVAELPVLAGAFSTPFATEVHEVDLVWSAFGPHQEPVVAIVLRNLKYTFRRRGRWVSFLSGHAAWL